MIDPTTSREHARALISTVARHLGLKRADLLHLYSQMKTQDDPCGSFCAACLYLEQDDSPIILQMLITGREKIAFKISPCQDPRFTLLYWTIDFFYRKSYTDFLTTNRTAYVKERVKFQTLSKEQITKPVGDPYLEREWEDPFEIKDTDTLPSLASESEAQGITEDESHQPEAVSSKATSIDKPKQKSGPSVTREAVKWNDEQDKAFREVFNWMRQSTRRQVFRLFGFAGTGKTTMAKEIAWNVESGENGLPAGPVLFAAYTGKAASILRAKGCAEASTIHSLIYKPLIDPETGKAVDFIVNRDSPLAYARLLIVDEVSMVDTKMAQDLLSFGVPVLVLGDPEQLDPIEGLGYFTQAKPDVMLTKVERQKDNAVLWLATRVRERKTVKPGRYDTSIVLPSDGEITDEMLTDNEQILVGTRRTRDAMNKRYRKLMGYYTKDSQFPMKGERLMCLKNNRNNGLLNGTMWTCTQPKFKLVQKLIDFRRPELGFEETNIMGLHFKVRSTDMTNSDGEPIIIHTVCSAHLFDSNLPEPPWRLIAGTDQFGFGYASTVHKGQGSQWESGVVIDESFVFPDQQVKHQYTALSRFVDRVVWRLP